MGLEAKAESHALPAAKSMPESPRNRSQRERRSPVKNPEEARVG
jgi:hypothetical protein